MSDIKSRLGRDWESRNPILRSGEPGYDKTSGRLKIGDGRTRWNDLSYFRSGEGRPRTRTLSAKLTPALGYDAAIPGYQLTQVPLTRGVEARGLYLGANSIVIPPGAGGPYTAKWNLRINGGDAGERNSQLRLNGTGVAEVGYLGTGGRPNGTELFDLQSGDEVDLAVYFAPTANLQCYADRDTNLVLVKKDGVPVKPVLIGNTGPTISGAPPRQIIGEWMTGNTTWNNLVATGALQSADLTAFVQSNPNGAADIGIPLIPHEQAPTSWNGLLDEVVAGTHDAGFTTLGRNLATYGPKTVYARPWWEFNLDFPGNNRPDATRFKAAWARAIPLIRSGFAAAARSGQTLSILYCTSEGRQPDLDTFWPGDAHVDVVSPDIYANVWGTVTPTKADLLTAMKTQLNTTSVFAARHRKPVAISEWANVNTHNNGTLGSQGRGDVPEFIDLMFDWAEQNQALYLIYYNISANVHQDMATTPLSRARYQARAPLAASGLESS